MNAALEACKGKKCRIVGAKASGYFNDKEGVILEYDPKLDAFTVDLENEELPLTFGVSVVQVLP